MQPPESWSLENRVAIVTGAARGIGLETVRVLRERGAQVLATDINPAVEDLGDRDIGTLVGDVGEEWVAESTTALALSRFGRVDILINNAGRTLNKPVTATSCEDWDAVLKTNARGNFLQSRAALRAMVAQGDGGTIVTVASIVAAVGLKETGAYAASKGAITQLTRTIAVEYGDRGIRANVVAPGVVETDILEGIVEDSRATLASYGGVHSLGRVAQPREIAEIVAFLSSPASSFMTGALVMADGGYTAL